jgi:hypothetical protein
MCFSCVDVRLDESAIELPAFACLASSKAGREATRLPVSDAEHVRHLLDPYLFARLD